MWKNKNGKSARDMNISKNIKTKNLTKQTKISQWGKQNLEIGQGPPCPQGYEYKIRKRNLCFLVSGKKFLKSIPFSKAAGENFVLF